MVENYERSFVKKYGELMLWGGALKFAKDSLSRALYSEKILEVIGSIKENDLLKQSYENLVLGEKEDLSLKSLEAMCNRAIKSWREEDKKLK